MAHEITNTDRYGEVRTGGKRAWHGLGEEIQEGLGAVAAAEEVGVGWTTSLSDVFCKETSIDDNGDVSENLVVLPSHKLHIRDDNASHLGMVSSGYQIFDNIEVCKFADALAGLDSAISVETIGTLRGGKRFFVLVKLPKVIQAGANDPLAQYVLLSNGHGGVAAFNAYPTSIRVVCANTLRWSERDVLKGCRFQHTGDLESKLGEVQAALGIALKETDKFEQQVLALSGSKVGGGSKKRAAEELAAYFTGVYDATELRLSDNEDRKGRVIEAWTANMEDERQLGGASLWTAYNSVSQWYDHERGRFKEVADSRGRVNSNLFGTADRFKRVAYNQALELV